MGVGELNRLAKQLGGRLLVRRSIVIHSERVHVVFADLFDWSAIKKKVGHRVNRSWDQPSHDTRQARQREANLHQQHMPLARLQEIRDQAGI